MALLDFHEVVDLVGRAASTEEAIELAVDLRPDLILVDLDMQFAEFLIAFIALSPDLSDLKVVGVAKGHELTARAAELVVSVSALISKANLREEFPRILKVLFNVEAARHRQPSLSPQ
jgi:DNA-binding NarL/FixJ family response regulator